MASKIISVFLAIAFLALTVFLEIGEVRRAEAYEFVPFRVLSFEGLLEYGSDVQAGRIVWAPVREGMTFPEKISFQTDKKAAAVLQAGDSLFVLNELTIMHFEEIGDKIAVTLQKGGAFVDALSEFREVRVQGGPVEFSIANGSAHIAGGKDEARSSVKAGPGGVSVNLLGDTQSAIFITPGKGANFDHAKLEADRSQIARLSAPQLHKEFVTDLAADDALIAAFAQQTKAWHDARGRTLLGNLRAYRRGLGSLGRQFQNILALHEGNRQERGAEHYKNDMDHALALLVRQDQEEAASFVASITMPDGEQARTDVGSYLKERLAGLSDLDVKSGVFASAKRYLLDDLIELDAAAADIPLRMYVIAADRLMRTEGYFSIDEAAELLLEYDGYVQKSGASLRNTLAHHNLLLAFLRSYPTAVTDETLALLGRLEQNYLGSLKPEHVLAASREFIADRINVLKTMQKLAADESVPTAEIRFAVRQTLADIERLKPAELAGSDLAALDSFLAAELQGMSDFLSFIESSYSSLHGAYKENFAAYVTDREESGKLKNLANDRADATGKPPVPTKSVKKTLTDDFASIGITDFAYSEPAAGTTRVEITTITVDGVVFAGTYDTERKAFVRMILVGNEIKQVIPIEQLSTFVLIRSGKTQADGGTQSGSASAKPAASIVRAPAKEDTADRIERLLREMVRDTLLEQDITIDSANITIADLEARLFRVKQASVKVDRRTVYFDFDIISDTEMVSNLTIITPEGPLKTNGTVPLKNLPARVTSLYSDAVK